MENPTAKIRGLLDGHVANSYTKKNILWNFPCAHCLETLLSWDWKLVRNLMWHINYFNLTAVKNNIQGNIVVHKVSAGKHTLDIWIDQTGFIKAEDRLLWQFDVKGMAFERYGLSKTAHETVNDMHCIEYVTKYFHETYWLTVAQWLIPFGVRDLDQHQLTATSHYLKQY